MHVGRSCLEQPCCRIVVLVPGLLVAARPLPRRPQEPAFVLPVLQRNTVLGHVHARDVAVLVRMNDRLVGLPLDRSLGSDKRHRQKRHGQSEADG